MLLGLQWFETKDYKKSLSALLDCPDRRNGAKWTRICRNPTAVAGMRVNDRGLALRVEGNVEAKATCIRRSG